MRKLLLTVIMFSVLSITSAQALSVNDISVDFDSQSVTINGSGTPNEDVVIQIINPGQDIPDPDAEFDSRIFNHFGNTAVGEDGNFSYRFIMVGTTTTDENKYLARVSAESGLDEKSFDFTSIDDIKNKLEIINSAADKETMKEAVEQAMKLLSVSPIAPYERLSEADRLKIAEKMVGAKPFSNIDLMLDTYNKFVLVRALHNEGDKTEFKNLLTEYAPELFDDIYKSSLSENGQNKSIDILKENISDVYDYESLVLNFKVAKLLACAQTSSKNNLVNALVEYKDVFDSSMTSYINSFLKSSGETKATVAGKILDKSPVELSQISKIIKEYFTSSKSSGGTSGGSGGGSSGKKTVSVDVVPQPVINNREGKNIFTDVDKSYWAYEAISYLYNKGVVSGKGDGRFEAEDLVTRAEMIKMLMLAFDVELTNDAEAFDDVSESDWCYKYICTAVKINVAKGLGNGSFAPQMNVTREDMAVFLDRAIINTGKKLPEGDYNAQFEDDSEISDYAKASVYAMRNAGIISGRSDGCFDPKAYATRAEMSKLLYVALQLI